MGMTLDNRKGTVANPNIVPLIDILLVLLIIFMVIQPPNLSKGHKAQLPQPTERSDEPALPNFGYPIVVQILDAGALQINGEPHTWASLGPRIAEIFKLRAMKVAFVKGSDAVLFQDVARAIDILRSNGVDRIGLLSAKLESSAAIPRRFVRN